MRPIQMVNWRHQSSKCRGGRISAKSASPALLGPRRNSGCCTCAHAAVSTKRREQNGSSVAYETIGTFFVTEKWTQRC